MRHPPYHLRSNKSVDRYLFVEILKRVFDHIDRPANSYTYVGFGGPFLEDLKIVEHYFPDVKLVSVERNAETVKRQQFHKFCRQVRLLQCSDEEFVDNLQEGTRLALWFDFLGCNPNEIGSFSEAVRKAGIWSVLRITLNAVMPNAENREKFIKDFDQLLPGDHESYFENQDTFLVLLQKIVQSATTPPTGSNYQFQILNASSYKDTARMLTITGIKCPTAEWKSTKKRFSKWPFFTSNWSHYPEGIDLPDLSLQERMRLACLLPTQSPSPGKRLKRRLGYSVGSEESLNSYAAFCRYFPVFGRLAM